jgi:hypothetical protein
LTLGDTRANAGKMYNVNLDVIYSITQTRYSLAPTRVWVTDAGARHRRARMVLSVIPAGLEVFSAANTAAAESISAAGSADSAAMLGAAAAALGPIGATYLAAYGPAQANNLAGTLLVGAVHSAIGGATTAAKAAYVATDDV